MTLLSIYEIWDKLPSHAKIILAVATLIATLVRPTILIIKWIKELKNPKQPQPINDELMVPFSIKISPRRKKIRWYKDKLNNHNEKSNQYFKCAEAYCAIQSGDACRQHTLCVGADPHQSFQW